jgi:hypothetical protein
MKKTYAGRELDAPWRAAADERIAKLRQGKITVRVVDAEGKAIEGAIDQTRDEAPFVWLWQRGGCAHAFRALD